MKAACWEGKHEIAVETVADPTLLKRRDAIVRVTSSAICGSDLHLYNGFIPSLVPGDILGHEFMGEVVDIGPEVRDISVGDRVVVAATVACGKCFFCEHDLWSLCDNSNPEGGAQEKLYGHSTSGIFGYSHLFGGYAGGQAEYVRVPYADVGMLRIPEGIPDEKVLFLSDILPTGWMGAENCGISGGETVAVWGCGPVGQMAIRSLRLLGAGRIVAIDKFPERLAMARSAGAEILDYEQIDVLEALKEMTGGMGPDACLDAVGMEAHGHGLVAQLDEVKQRVRLESDRPYVLRQMILACRKGGTISILGVYSGLIDNFPMGVAFNKGLTFRMGQLNAQKYLKPLLERIEREELDPSFVITHRLPLAEAARGYRIFDEKSDGCIKVVLKP